jgi:hypothetical protein
MISFAQGWTGKTPREKAKETGFYQPFLFASRAGYVIIERNPVFAAVSW